MLPIAKALHKLDSPAEAMISKKFEFEDIFTVQAVSTSEVSTQVENENTHFDLQDWDDWMNSETEETMDSEQVVYQLCQ